MRGICLGRTGLVEIFLYNLRTKIDEYVFKKKTFFFFRIKFQLIFKLEKNKTSIYSFSYLYGMETNPSDPQYRFVLNNSLCFECE